MCERCPARRIVLPLLVAAAVAIGAVHAWSGRHAMNPDGISYIEMAREFAAGDSSALVNGYWSPLYPFLVGLTLWVIDPGPAWEAGVAHLVNYLIYIAGLAVFMWLWAECAPRSREEREGEASHRQSPEGSSRGARGERGDGGRGGTPAQGVSATRIQNRQSTIQTVSSVGVYCWLSLRLIGLDRVGPDLLAAACLFAATGFLARLHRGPTFGGAVGLGVSLGLGCLAKSIMFPTTAVCLLAAFVLAGPWRRHWLKPALAGVLMTILVAPYVLQLSLQKGRLTWGDAGWIAYAGCVSIEDPAHLDRNGNGRRPFDWPQDPGRFFPQLLPTQVLNDNPLIHEFDGPVGGSYPLWRDPSFWYGGLVASFYWPGQVRALAHSLGQLWSFMARDWGWAMLAVLLMGLPGLWKQRWRALLLGPALAQLGMLALVLVIPRYIAGPVAIMVAVLASAVSPGRRVLLAATAIAVWAGVAFNTVEPLRSAWPDVRWFSDASGSSHWLTAQAMREAGLQPGDAVGHVGAACKSWSYWASLAGVQIIAEFRPGDVFWSATAEQQAEWVDVFRQRTRVRALVARPPAGTPLPAGWREVAGTGFRLLMIDDEPSYRSSAPAG